MTTHAALDGLGLDDWRRQTRVVLQPIAAPSILGLYAFSAATMMVAARPVLCRRANFQPR